MVSHLTVMESEWNIHENCECAIYIFQFQVIQPVDRHLESNGPLLFREVFVKSSVTVLGEALQSNLMRLTSPKALRDNLQKNIALVASPLCNLQDNRLQEKNSLLLFATLRDSSQRVISTL